MNLSWKDVLHYGTAAALGLAALFAPALNTLPGIHIDAATASAAAVGIFAAGLKGGITSGK